MKDRYCLIAIGISFVLFVILQKLCKNKKPVKRALITMLTGLFTLIGVNVTGMFTGVVLPYSILSITVSMIGGIPGVTTMLGLNLFF